MNVVEHVSRDTIYDIKWKVGYSTSLPLVAECDGYIYTNPTLTNIASILIDGLTPTYPFQIAKGLSYSVTPTIINNTLEAKAVFVSRKEANSTIVVVSPTILAENIQGTHSFYMHPSDNKMTIVLSSLLVDGNYISGTSWTTDPRTIISLPAIANFVWDSGFWDYTTDRAILIARTTVNSVANFHLCAFHLSGVKMGQIWNLQGTVQNSYNTILSDTFQAATIFPVIDYNTNSVSLYGAPRLYQANLSNLLSWVLNTNGSLLGSFGYYETLVRKFGYSHKDGKFITSTCFQNDKGNYDRLYNYFTGYENTICVGIDNVTGNIYKSYDAPGIIRVFNKNIQISSVLGATYVSKLAIVASVKRRILITKQLPYSDHPQRINLYNLDGVSLLRQEVVFNDANVTNCLDGDYLNSIDKFAILSEGAVGTSGRRLIYILSADYDGVNPLLKYKILLDFDSRYMFTNRIRY